MSLQVVGDMVTQQLVQRGHYDRARMFNDLLERKRPGAWAQLRKALKAASYEERSKMLRFAKDLFGVNDPIATDTEKSSMQFLAQAEHGRALLRT